MNKTRSAPVPGLRRWKAKDTPVGKQHRRDENRACKIPRSVLDPDPGCFGQDTGRHPCRKRALSLTSAAI
jgi:hypothetical protein